MEQGTSRRVLGLPTAQSSYSSPTRQRHVSLSVNGSSNAGVRASTTYYDLYPERKRTGPYVPKADLVAHSDSLIPNSRTTASSNGPIRRSRSGDQLSSYRKGSSTFLASRENKNSSVRSPKHSRPEEITIAAPSTVMERTRPRSCAKEPVMSIDDIVRAHSGNLLLVPGSQRGPQRSLSWSAFPHSAPASPTRSLRESSSYHETLSDTDSDHSAGSVEQEARTILQGGHRLASEMSRLEISKQVSGSKLTQQGIERKVSVRSSSPDRSPSRQSSFREAGLAGSTRARTRLTCRTLVKVAGAAPLQVSFADVGLEDGHPVMVFLGLGASRHLIGLYDELAASLGLRLVCIDRWGIGRTDSVAPETRKILSWSLVVEEVANLLDLDRFSILAHSAGAPFAAAFAILFPHRVQGPLNLLSPWTGMQQDSGYRWLRYLPEGVIKTAHAADSRIQGWRLSKEEAKVANRPRASSTLVRRTNGSQHDSNDADRPPTPPPKDPAWQMARSASQTGSIDSSRSTLTVDVNERSSAIELLRASHSESARGLVDDLNLILGKRPWGFAFSDVKLACEVWHGSKDERIPLSSSMSLSREMRDCLLHVVDGASHSLMTNSEVLIEVFESIREHASW